MKYIILLFCLLSILITSCNSKTKKSNVILVKTKKEDDYSKVKSIIVDTVSNKVVLNKIDDIKVNKKKKQVIEIWKDSLYSKNFLENYANKIEIISKDCFSSNFFYMDAYKLDLQDFIIKDFSDELYATILVIYKENEIVFQKVIFSVDESDTSISFIEKNKCFILVEFYSEPVGYFEYYVYSPLYESFYKTEKIDEAKKIDTQSINIKNKTYNLQNDKEVHNLVLDKTRTRWR